jgi:hypothetical protein
MLGWTSICMTSLMAVYVSGLVGHSRMLCATADMLVMLLDPSLNGEDAHCTPSQQNERQTQRLSEKIMEAFHSHPGGTQEH